MGKVIIKDLTLKNTYKIVWLQYISGVNLNEHCKKSFLGYSDKRFRGYMRHISDAVLDESRYYYLCGVDENWVYKKNMHVAFVKKEGSCVEIDNNLFHVRIENAAQLVITPNLIDWTLPHANDKYYNTCRNWQFANMLVSIDESIKNDWEIFQRQGNGLFKPKHFRSGQLNLF